MCGGGYNTFKSRYLNTSVLFPDSANFPSFSTNVSQLFFTRGTI